MSTTYVSRVLTARTINLLAEKGITDCEYLHELPRSIDLSATDITDDDLRELEGCYVRELRLAGCNLLSVK